MSTSLCKHAFFTVALLVLVECTAVAQVPTTPPETNPVLLQMIRDDAIHRELRLTDDQVRRVFETIVRIDGPWYHAGRLPVAERIGKIRQLSDQMRNSLTAILDQQQLQRLDQLCNQALGTRMIVLDRTAKSLDLDAKTRDDLYAVYQDTDKVAGEVKAKVKEGELEASEATAKLRKAQAAERKEFTDALTNEQKRKLASLTGQPFDFTSIRRKYPRAPEIESSGTKWLQGGDQSLEGLRGKVVALHFYAFGCINCKRNLPHYNAWHDDFADQGLVVIGIQSPETRAERTESKVVAAMKKEGMEYPVLFDQQMANWNKWAVSWWPTVVLIDKKGFIRSIWEGEMNWKGNPGEQQMRKNIERLLAEDA